ncbi:hypothetical protein [Ruminococcus albus]|uniref:hypothetical protein n=1 Tax=Ruminococcus albus TaxID=1264 RepID=UPI0018AD517B|nr:hypothetical protein [Ruminococcus albus]
MVMETVSFQVDVIKPEHTASASAQTRCKKSVEKNHPVTITAHPCHFPWIAFWEHYPVQSHGRDQQPLLVTERGQTGRL